MVELECNGDGQQRIHIHAIWSWRSQLYWLQVSYLRGQTDSSTRDSSITGGNCALPKRRPTFFYIYRHHEGEASAQGCREAKGCSICILGQPYATKTRTRAQKTKFTSRQRFWYTKMVARGQGQHSISRTTSNDTVFYFGQAKVLRQALIDQTTAMLETGDISMKNCYYHSCLNNTSTYYSINNPM